MSRHDSLFTISQSFAIFDEFFMNFNFLKILLYLGYFLKNWNCCNMLFCTFFIVCFFPNNIESSKPVFLCSLQQKRLTQDFVKSEEEQRILFSLQIQWSLHSKLTDVSPVLRVFKHGHTYQETVPERST